MLLTYQQKDESTAEEVLQLFFSYSWNFSSGKNKNKFDL